MREPIDPVRVEALKRMTPAEKLQMVADLYEAEIGRRMEGLRTRHPDWTDEQLSFEARRSFSESGT